jgi:hypothetical protein
MPYQLSIMSINEDALPSILMQTLEVWRFAISASPLQKQKNDLKIPPPPPGSGNALSEAEWPLAAVPMTQTRR